MTASSKAKAAVNAEIGDSEKDIRALYDDWFEKMLHSAQLEALVDGVVLILHRERCRDFFSYLEDQAIDGDDYRTALVDRSSQLYEIWLI